MNNPLSYTDPSGEFIPLVIWGAVALYKAYDTYDTITSGAEDLATSLDDSLSTEERALAATSLAANVVGVPRFVRKYSGKLFSKSKAPDNNKVDTGTSSNSPNKNQGDSNTSNDAPASSTADKVDAPADNNVPKYARNKYKGVSQKEKTKVKAENPVCVYCDKKPSTTVDHVRSQKQDWVEGGWKDSREVRSARVNEPENLTGACRSCNSSKGSKPLGEADGQWIPPKDR
jgi:hypothetical protein